MRQDVQFGSWSLAAAGAAVILAQAFHPILVASINIGETAAWLAMFLAGLLALALYLVVSLGLRPIANGNLIDLARAGAGRTGAIVTALLVCSLLIYHSGLIIRQTSEMAVGAVYTHTPQTFATVTLVICTLYAAHGKIVSLVRLTRAFLPFLLLSILVILIGGAAWGSPRFLLPFWGPGPGALLVGSVRLGAFYCPLILTLLIAAGHVRDRQHLWRGGAVAIGGPCLLLALIKIVLLMTYPLPLGYSVTYPLHELARLVVGGRFFERIEGMWVVMWVFATSCHLATLLHAAAAAYAGAFGMLTHRPAVLPLVTMSAVVAFFPRDQGQSIAWSEQAFPFYVAIGLGLPVALALLAAVRRRIGREA
ncbi:MAG TPA: GerAB/ArcD/ProY family transporter [Symbiobacteriaceae bacterium]|nr:GerAB/ArcD/ProY family transporter [Symbiobacteriaceae bacterium]